MDKLTGGVRPYLVLSLFCLLLYLPGLSAVPPLDRDESRFIQATRQMLESGDWIRIQFQNEMRAKKPAGAYWAQALAVEALSHPLSRDPLPYRLPGALAAWIASLVTFWAGASLLGRRPALLAGLFLGGALMVVSEAHQAKTDALLLACATVAQCVLARVYVAARAKEIAAATPGGSSRALAGPGLLEVLLFWVAQGAGILVKGPIVPVVSLLTIAALAVADRKIRWVVALRPVTGALVTAAMAAPWFVAISQATGGAFVGEAVKSDLLPKLLGSQESHGAWPGYYLLLAVVTFWPGSLLAWPAMVAAWGQRKRLAFRVLLAWILPAWAMFELVPTKLPHYVLPTFPAIALIAAALVTEKAEVFQRLPARIYYIVWTLVGLTLAAAVVALPIRFGHGFTPASLPAAAGIVLATLLPAVLAFRGRLTGAALALGLSALATYPAVFSEVLPKLDRLWVGRELAWVVDSLGTTQPIAAAGYSEPSLVVWLGTKTVLTDGAGAAAYLVAHPGALAAVSDDEEAGFKSTAAAKGLVPERLGEVSGFNYSRGKPVHLLVYGGARP